jgi:hypothetical protein
VYNEILTLYSDVQFLHDPNTGEEVPVNISSVEVTEVVTAILEHMQESGITPDDWTVTLARFALRRANT